MNPKHILIRIKVPEEYEDVNPIILLDDFLDTSMDPEWEPEVHEDYKWDKEAEGEKK